MRKHFVVPSVVRLHLADGDWIDVKQELTTGEQRAMFAEMRKRYAPGEIPMFDPARVETAKVEAYLLAWSFTDSNGKPVPVTAGAIDQLRTAIFSEIKLALDAHIAEQESADQDEKKILDTPTGSAPTS